MPRASDALRSMTPSNSTADVSARVGVVGSGPDGTRDRAGFRRLWRRGRSLRARRRALRDAGTTSSQRRSPARSRAVGSIPPQRPPFSPRSKPAGIGSGLRRLRPRDRKRAGRSRGEERRPGEPSRRPRPRRSSRARRRGSRSAGLRRLSPIRPAFSGCISFLRRNACLWSRSWPDPAPSDKVVRRALDLVRGAGKQPMLVRDGPGFFATRVFAAYLDEAVAMATEGIAVESIEAAAIANGRALGPLAMLDETGIALNLSQARQARADGLEPRFCRPLAEPTLAASRGGRSIWPARGRRLLRLAERRPAHAVGGPQRPLSASRRMSPSRRPFDSGSSPPRRARRCAASRRASSRAQTTPTLASVLGLGFPKARGGVLRWAENFGLRRVRRGSGRLAETHGDRFSPSPWLRALAARAEGLGPYRGKDLADVTGPLAGLRVVELGGIGPAPFAGASARRSRRRHSAHRPNS